MPPTWLQHMIENLSGSSVHWAPISMPLGLAAHSVGELSQGGTGAAARVEQTNCLSRREASGPDEGRDPLDR